MSTPMTPYARLGAAARRGIAGWGVSCLLSVGAALAGTGYHHCAISDAGQLKCWGWNNYGQLGLGDTNNRGDSPNEMGNALGVVELGAGRVPTQVVYGAGHTCALLDNGLVKCWGRNDLAQLGHGDTTRRGDGANEMGDNLPYTDLGAGRTAISLNAGVHHTCAILDNGGVKCWGYNPYGNLGNGSTGNLGDHPSEVGDGLPLVALGAGRTAVQLASGYYHTCALLDDSSVKCWGYNNYGQLGYGNTASRGDNANEMGDNLPTVDLGAGNTVAQLSASLYHTCALFDDGRLKCWGLNNRGQLGQGDTTHRGDNSGEMGGGLPYIDLGAGRSAVAISSTNHGNCAILDNGQVRCWGRNDLAQLGQGDTTQRGDGANEMGDNLPYTDLGTGRAAVELGSGYHSTCALLDDGAFKCWGYNPYGNVGTGDNNNMGDVGGETGDSLPVVSLGVGFNVVSVANGSSFGCPDLDGDGICDVEDICPNVANPDQADDDGDGLGDACELCPGDAMNDTDGDEICHGVDNCPRIANADQTDDNGDGFGDACVNPSADIHPTARLSSGVIVGAGADIGAYAEIGPDATVNGVVGHSVSVGAGSNVGAGCVVGDNTTIGESVGLGADCALGSRVWIGDGVSVGAGVSLGTQAIVGDNVSLGVGVSVGNLSSVSSGGILEDGASVGDNTRIGLGGHLGAGSAVAANTRAGAGLTMGANASVGSNVRLGDFASLGDEAVIRSQVVVGDDLMMGARAELASGASAGDGVTIGDDAEVRGSLGDGVTLEADVFVGNQSSLGADCVVGEGASVGLFATIGPRCALGTDTAIFDGVQIGADATFGARNTVLFRTAIGDGATLGDDNLIDEQITVGHGFELGTNSRLWPFSNFGDELTVGDGVLVRANCEVGDGVTFEDNTTIWPRTVIGNHSTVRAGVIVGAGDCRGAGCGHVIIGDCRDVGDALDPFAEMRGACTTGLMAVDGVRLWADGQHASSCDGYRHPTDAEYAYEGDVGSGDYVVNLGAQGLLTVYCDMDTDGGGWTMIGNGPWWTSTLGYIAPGQPAGQLSTAQIDALRSSSEDLFRVGNGASRMFIRDAGARVERDFHYWRSTANDLQCATGYAAVQADAMVDVGGARMSCDGDGIGDHTCGVNSGWILVHDLDAYNVGGTHPCSFGAAYYPTGQALNTLWLR